MALNPMYITSVELQSYFVDKDTGLPLAGGQVWFYEDTNRNQLKNVYELTGSPPNYQYAPLPNPITLSGVGTFMDDDGNDIAVYYFPFDDFGNVQLYYVAVYAAGVIPPGGTPEFTREAWPGIIAENGTPGSAPQSGFENALSNSQFVDVDFISGLPYEIQYAANISQQVQIGPDWILNFTTNASGTIVIERNAISGISQFATNPPYMLAIQAGSGLTSLTLSQRLYNNAGIWSATTNKNGWIAGSITLGANTGTVTMTYLPSLGIATEILSGSNANTFPLTLSGTVSLPKSNNPNSPPDAYVDIQISIPLGAGNVTSLTSVQVVGLDTEIDNIGYDQETVNRQKDHLFHYYNPLLQYKPIPSYLIGWDFPVNPAQLGATFNPLLAGANQSQYTWDQTIVYQQANNSVTVSRAPSGAFRLTAGATSPFAVIQYLSQISARELLNDEISVNLQAVCSNIGGAICSINLYYTKSISLPNVGTGTYQSLISATDSNGVPTAFNGGPWFAVPRTGLQPVQFGVEDSLTTEFNNYSFSGWNLNGAADANLATYFAIVISFDPTAIGDTIDIANVGLCQGAIATRPPPLGQDETLRQCEVFYEQSYQSGTLPGTAATQYNAQTSFMQSTIPVAGTFNTFMQPSGFTVTYRTSKYIPTVQLFPTVTLYSSNTGASGNVAEYLTNSGGGPIFVADAAIATGWNSQVFGDKFSSYFPTAATINGASASGSVLRPNQYYINYHYTVDSRLGIVL
jgi:hypothetical protein